PTAAGGNAKPLGRLATAADRRRGRRRWRSWAGRAAHSGVRARWPDRSLNSGSLQIFVHVNLVHVSAWAQRDELLPPLIHFARESGASDWVVHNRSDRVAPENILQEDAGLVARGQSDQLLDPA